MFPSWYQFGPNPMDYSEKWHEIFTWLSVLGGALEMLSNIYDDVFRENSEWLSAVTIFKKSPSWIFDRIVNIPVSVEQTKFTLLKLSHVTASNHRSQFLSKFIRFYLTHSWRGPLSYRNQSFDLLCKHYKRDWLSKLFARCF